MILSAVAAVAIGWLTRSYWLAFVAGLVFSYASALATWVLYSDLEDLNDYQFRTILAGFLAGALGIVVAFLRTAYDEYRKESLAAAEVPRADAAAPRMSATMRRRLGLVDARAKTLGNDISNMTFGLVDRWVNRASYRDAGRE